MKRLLSCLMVLVLGLATWMVEPAYSQSLNGIHRVEASSFNQSTARITLDELPSATYNPVYTPDLYGANDTAPSLTFKAMFEGQSYSGNAAQDCQGASPFGCIIGNPSNPLSLSSDRYTRITQIVSNPDLSYGQGLGTQQNAAYSILFDKDIASVGVTVAGFDAIGSTAVKVFDRAGKLLGQATNRQTGTEFFGFATDDGEDKIAGVQVSMVAPEDDGYFIGDITFVQKAYQPTVETPKGVHPVEASDLKPPTGYITFDEVSYATFHPLYTPDVYEANDTAPTLTFKAMFEGQSYSRNAGRDCQGASPFGCIIGNPSNPLSLSNNRYTRGSYINKNSDLSDGRSLGTQQYAAYSILFDKDVASVGLTVGALDKVGSTVIKVFDRTGKLLGRSTNPQTGNQFFGFATDDGEDKIAGVQVTMVAPEDDGYHLGDITFVQKAYTPPNQKPVAGVIPDRTATDGEVFSFTIPDGTFTDPDGDDNNLSFTATLEDGSPIPSWLTFNANTQTFSGMPDYHDDGTFTVKVTASDGQGSASSTFDLTVETIEFSSIVDIDPTQNHDSSTALTRNLPAGEYQVEVIGTAEGGQFNAWSSTCNCKWDTYYSRRLGSSGWKKMGNPNKYNSVAEALANRVPSTSFTLTDDTDVKFYTYSTSAADNIGGVSMQVEGNGINQSVDLDATQNVNKEHAKVCNLPAGDYTVTLLGTAEGGKYDAWSSTCSKKWHHAYKIRGDAHVTVTETGVYGNAGEALAHRPAAETFRLDDPGEVKFYTNSTHPENDCGGVSLNVTRIGS
ncbi:MAG: putative Ig domain-containing protein [Cyanobacteriota bacterium]|nr:putative Ig domain-containing protein [Cyanobacteriota bacterium]